MKRDQNLTRLKLHGSFGFVGSADQGINFGITLRRATYCCGLLAKNLPKRLRKKVPKWLKRKKNREFEKVKEREKRRRKKAKRPLKMNKKE